MTTSETIKQLIGRANTLASWAWLTNDEQLALTDALRALEQEPTLMEELSELRTLVRNQTKWMAWCDSQILERAEQAEAEVTRLRAELAALASPVSPDNAAVVAQDQRGER